MAIARITQQDTEDDLVSAIVFEVEVKASFPDAIAECVAAVRRMYTETMVND